MAPPQCRGSGRAAAAAATAAVALLGHPGGGRGAEPPQRPEDRAVWTAAEMFGQEAGLRRELAALLAERSWLRSSPDKHLWSPHETWYHLSGLHQEIATLRTEVAWLRREDAVRHPDVDVALVAPRPPPPPDADHAPALFITMCAGSVYFDTYCGPLLASFERAYGAAAGKHRFVVFHASVEKQIINAATERFRPWVAFEPLARGGLTGDDDENYNSTITGNSDNIVCDIEDGKVVNCRVTQDGVENRGAKVNNNNFWFPFHVSAYLRRHSDTGFCHAVLMDSDAMIVRPLGRFLPSCRAGPSEDVDWDVGFTVYDPEFAVPWAEDPAEVGRTRSGLSRINTGVVLISLQNLGIIESFLKRWAQATVWLHSGGEEAFGQKWEGQDKAQWELWRDELLEEFRGPNQASLVLLLCSYHVDRLYSLIGWETGCAACGKAAEARLDLLDGEPPISIRMRALPARILNHPESMPAGRFPADVLVVHLKGLWWRTALPEGAMLFTDPHRKSIWNRDALALHRLLYETWHAALPPESHPREESRMVDSSGRTVSKAEAESFLNSQGASP